MSNDPIIEQKEEQQVLSIRTRTAVQDLPKVLGQSYDLIVQYLCELGEAPAGPPFVGYFNMDMQDLDVEIGFPVTRPLPGKAEIQPSQLPAGNHATCLHSGSYKALEQTYNALQKFIAEGGHKPSGVAYEFYLNDPNETPEDQLQTQIVFPLEET